MTSPEAAPRTAAHTFHCHLWMCTDIDHCILPKHTCEAEAAAGTALDVERLAQAFHMSQRCVHGVGTGEPMQTPGYLAPDREWAEAIAAEYARLAAATGGEGTADAS